MSFYDDYEIEEYEKTTEEIKSQIANKKLKKVNLNEINIDDVVYISFLPYSQKYIYSLSPKLGKVISIANTKITNYNDREEIILDITIQNHKNQEEYLFHPGVSYMGHSLGYDYLIYLVE
jgi:hypothetical protein